MKNTYIKLFIGAALLAIWLGLVVFKVPDAGDLITAIKLGLLGLGFYHMGDRSDTPTDRQGGAALPGLLAMLGLGAALTLAGCATPAGQAPTQATQVTITQACAAYGASFSVALELRRAGKLNKPQIDQITLLDNSVTPLCTGPLPTDPTAAAQQVTTAVTTLAILEAINKETK